MPIQCFTLNNFILHFTSINFAENQLSLSLIGLSPLITNHLSILQHTQVRPKSLFIIRSLSFGFNFMFGTGWRGRTALSAFKAKIGGVDAPVAFAGAQGEFTGLDQMNVELPTTLRGRGEVTINCTVDNRPANPVTVTIK